MISRNRVLIKSHRGVKRFRHQSQIKDIMDGKGSDDVLLKFIGKSKKQMTKT